MKKATILVVILTVLIFSLMNYERRSTVQEWKDHLFIPIPRMDQTISNMIGGFDNIEELPPGTHILFTGAADGYFQEDTAILNTSMEVTVQSGVIQGKECTVVEITFEMEHSSVSMTVKSTEWVDRTGTPLRMEGEIGTSLVEGTGSLTRYALELVGEEQYKEFDCWIYGGTERTEVAGMKASIETEIMRYVDKESKAVVRLITNNGQTDLTMDTSFMSGLEWELGGREITTTDVGKYESQVIYLKNNDRIVGTMWVNRAFRTPLKYVIFYEREDSKLEMVMTLVEYTWEIFC
ncbi:MAG: hypothetical protein HXS44_07165 [Theionarchaea archaeon]|nr:hypothetical protein [Theionarchaea archaeon]